jgi:hypothetical protein
VIGRRAIGAPLSAPAPAAAPPARAKAPFTSLAGLAAALIDVHDPRERDRIHAEWEIQRQKGKTP